MPGIILGARDMVVNKKDRPSPKKKIPALMILIFWLGET